jgi:hypothetical protein
MDPFVPVRDLVRFDGHNQEKTLYFPFNTIQYNLSLCRSEILPKRAQYMRDESLTGRKSIEML